MQNALVSQIINFFGSSLSPVPESSLHAVELSEETKDFLLSVGLPPGGSLLLTFYSNGDRITTSIEREAHFLIIGDDSMAKLGLKEQTGEVFALGWGRVLPTRFMNSSILKMLVFLMIYMTKQLEWAEVTSDEGAWAIIEQMRTTLLDIDGRALDDPDNWWSVILELMEQELL
jgi:hypothetical protein